MVTYRKSAAEELQEQFLELQKKYAEISATFKRLELDGKDASARVKEMEVFLAGVRELSSNPFSKTAIFYNGWALVNRNHYLDITETLEQIPYEQQ